MIALAFWVGTYLGDDNRKLSYGPEIYGRVFPKNCRAIIYENYEGYRRGEYSAEDTIRAINRNCGASGYSWKHGQKKPITLEGLEQ